MTPTFSGPWALVFDLQQTVALHAVGPRAFGCDEALEVLLDGIVNACVPDRQVVDNLCANRAGKDRHRRRLVRREVSPGICPCPVEAIHLKRCLAFVRRIIGDEDFDVLIRVADTSYREVASAIRIPVGTLKARVARAKAKVREAWVQRFGASSMMEAA